MTSVPPGFDVLGPLPSGVAVLEASAGTGKTFTIAALAARYVADGVPLDELLVVTFTRMATSELRERVRERLVSAERVLQDVIAGAAPPPLDDPVAALLATGTPGEVEERRRRLARAVADFDAATITTTHGFCLEALGSLGFAGDIERECTFAEDVGDLIDEVVDDLYVRRFWKYERRMTRKQAHQIANKAIANASAHLEPSDTSGDSDPAMRARLAIAAREELERRKRLASVMTYDDLLTRLDGTLAAGGGETVAARLRERYRIVLVDEFQDTDPVQWSIMRRAFAHPGGTLVLIGDPKQAIYAFRGADVYAYLEAAAAAGTRATLNVNWRSDQRLLDAYDQLFGAAQLGHPGIVYHPVRATGAHQAPRVRGTPVDAPLRVRIVDRDAADVGTTSKGYARKDPARVHIARDLADDVVALLSSAAQLTIPERDGEAAHRRVRPEDVAVLVRRNRDAGTVREMLEAAGVPAVINGAGSVFASPSARHWLQLLEALERPTSSPRARAAALTPFVGWSAAAVAAADDDSWELVHDRLHQWAHVLRSTGVASLLETITLRQRLPERVLALTDGERELTDLRHVGQLLHAAAIADHLGTPALTSWLRRRIAESGSESDEERSLRLESDAAAVQVLTIHRSKGLEFGIVYYPYLWDPSWIPEKPPEPVFFHDPEHGERRTLDVALEGSAYATHARRQRDELRGEDLRLAYVALTRARHQAVVWWAGAWGAQDSALGRLVFSQQPDGVVPSGGEGVPTDAGARTRFQELAAAAPGCISVEPASPGTLPRAWSDTFGEDVTLAAATFDRDVDRAWRRTSYSDMTAFGAEARVASEPETRLLDDEGGEEPLATRAEEPAPTLEHLRAIPSLLGQMPAGVHIGTLVHDMLETTDFAAADLRGEIAERLREQRARRPLDVGDAAAAVDGLAAALQTPLGPLLGGRALSTIPRGDRIDEMAFELPLAGGDRSTSAAALTPRSIAGVLRDHLEPDDLLHGYAERLGDPDLRARVRGYLTGSIDLVLRVSGPEGPPRYAIADYKTNRLGDYAEPLTAWDHRPEALQSVMYHAHYALQGLLYTVALHRYLRWRLPDHDPDRDVAGVFHLFLRGMTGPDTPRVDGTPCGVFAWRPPGVLIRELSDLLDRGAEP